MLVAQVQDLTHYNSFAVTTKTPQFYVLTEPTQLAELPNLTAQAFYILGEGSNTLFVDELAPIIIKPAFKKRKTTETEDAYYVTLGSGENWHQTVQFCTEQGIAGLENLALIPGSVGAAPVQNIGAYGIEFKDVCHSVSYYDLTDHSLHTLTAEQCQFGYRDSLFKHQLKHRAIIVEVCLKLNKHWQAKLSYAGLNQLPANCSAVDVMQQVIAIRQQKLPDPQTLPNAGSFFKNPVVSNEQFLALQQGDANMPHYVQADGSIKLAAGYLIEQTGLKGYELDGVGVHKNQALVLVNYSSKHGTAIVKLAYYVQQQVFNKYHIMLEPEVRMIGQAGETTLAQLTELLA